MPPRKQSVDLTALNQVARALAEAKDLKEVKALRDKAEAARTYIQRAALGQKIQNQAAELKLRAERRAGEILNEMAPHGGNRRSSRHDGDLKLSALGINSGQSSRWRREAAVPEVMFEQYIAKANEVGKDISSQGLLRIERVLALEKDVASQRPRRNRTPVTADPRVADQPTVPSEPVDDQTADLLSELENHRDLLASIISPLCDHDKSPLDKAERRLVNRLLADLKKLISRLQRQLRVGLP